MDPLENSQGLCLVCHFMPMLLILYLKDLYLIYPNFSILHLHISPYDYNASVKFGKEALIMSLKGLN